MSLKHALLGFLTFEPATGYELKGKFDRSVRHFWHADLSQIYRTLNAMESEGWVQMEIKHQESRPPKHIYAVTEAGRAELLDWLAQPMKRLPTVRNEFLIKIFFGGLLGPEAVIGHLRRYRDQLAQRLEIYGQVEAGLEAGRASQSAHDLVYPLSTLRLGIRIMRAQADWCEETIREIDTIAETDATHGGTP